MDKKMQEDQLMMLAMGKAQEELLDDKQQMLLNSLTVEIAQLLHNQMDDTDITDIEKTGPDNLNKKEEEI